jgi:hypothetical protein
MSNTLVVTGKLPYQVHKLLGETESYRLYQVTTNGIEKPFVLKVAADAALNGRLEREAYLLSRMHEHALALEEEFGKLHPGKVLNYHLAFPHAEETFVLKDQGGRRVLILEVKAKQELEKLVPLSMIRTRDCVRVDHKTASWMLGKSLKILAFAHDFSISLGSISGDDIVVDRDSHLVMFFDWSQATRVSGGGELSTEIVHQEMYMLAREVAQVMGGNPLSFSLPESVDDPDMQLQEFVLKLSRGGFSSASIAHKEFYQMVEAMWGRKFHPYTCFPL